MGNRAVITTPERKVGLYLHWHGGHDTVAPLLKYCELKGYRPPSADEYGWARLCQVIGNFFGGTLSVGIGAYATDEKGRPSDERMDPGDNGIYVIDGWKIVERVGYDYAEQAEHDFGQMLRAFDAHMPEHDRLGEYLDSVEIPTSELQIGDEVWFEEGDGSFASMPVAGFAKYSTGRCSGKQAPYVKRYDHDGDWTWNPNNFVHGETCRIRQRA